MPTNPFQAEMITTRAMEQSQVDDNGISNQKSYYSDIEEVLTFEELRNIHNVGTSLVTLSNDNYNNFPPTPMCSMSNDIVQVHPSYENNPLSNPHDIWLSSKQWDYGQKNKMRQHLEKKSYKTVEWCHELNFPVSLDRVTYSDIDII